ncbi:MAG: Hsp20/alpha crystallin family protein [Vicinamibacteria bacterium]
MVERRDAFPEMGAIQKEISRLFEQLAHFERSEAGLDLGEWLPSFDVFETKDTLIIKVEAPGMTKKDLTAAFQGHKLIVSGEKKEPKTEQPINGYLCMERSFGKFTRSIYVDQAVDLAKADAQIGQGVLTITIPKLKDRRGSKIRLKIKEQD